ncbi:serine hydrolase domain-containing protein [Zhihengliuella sp.]|uniref:serine hydrolase domain-containing protein n=1 Tax=Zhihengliuella sp. TaxID=1954483 RepID=UPI002810DC3B|nr:serine hydrolase domain-containing protein [Zhihengliuella sp.]
MTWIDPRFQSVADVFEGFALDDPDYSGQFAAYVDGELVLDLAVGDHLGPDDLTGVFSCTKGAAGLVMALLVQDGLLDLDATVAHYWPEFAAEGKQDVSVRQLLSHQAGLTGVEGGFTEEEYIHSELAAAKLAAAAPRWRPGAAHAYHGLTIGVLMEELVRRITGGRLQDLYEERIRAPHGADFYLGLPEDQDHRYRDVLRPAQPGSPIDVDPFGQAGLAYNSTAGFAGPDGASLDLLDLPNQPRMRRAGISSAGGVASAQGMAKVYAATSTGVVLPHGRRADALLTGPTQRAFSQTQVYGPDVSHGGLSAYGVVFMASDPGNDFGSWRVFGHNGANGSIGYADPAYGLAVGYVPARAEANGTAARNGRLSKALRRAVLDARTPQG